eukprot:3707062-Amphidinium_carterae.1
MDITVPKGTSRTNLSNQEGGDQFRSFTFGLYTARGYGMTKYGHQMLELLKALHQLARTRTGDMAVPYLAIT